MTLWHSRILPFLKLMRQYGRFAVLTSSHFDGDIIASLVDGYDHDVIRGSSRKNWFAAIKQIMREIESGKNVAITPDGPLGPRYKVNGSVAKIASRQNVPVISASYSAKPAVVLSTWDRFVIPLPFSKIVLEIGPPILFEGNSELDNLKLGEVMLEQMVRLDKAVHLQIDY
ncbi:lysophospholipid acyltransferase family protein [Rickettsiales endosymbiont of Peranema trichophorum]|uniref:lysophospholipid acyltransferase family protein n=1 Tax=Rickettsiales endosymbiont of Peranema trichophorum TaxID=2486577 RepID=UPI0013EEBFC9|nr:DUF374 domain-containing protein [Rickettsiales endosymbiont of Peranema trichophorum]